MAFTYADFTRFAPGLPPSLAEAFLDAWVDQGVVDLALDQMRQHADYDTYFVGNRRDDGSLRYDEGTYLSLVDSYRRTVEGVGINPDIFDSQEYGAVIAGEKSPAEFASEVSVLEQRILGRGDTFLQEFAAVNAMPITREAAIASLMSPRVDRAVLERKITVAEISAESTLRGAAFGLDAARQLYEFGFSGAQAGQLAGQAAELMPAVDVLAKRHLDPDDTFDLAEFLEGFAFEDPTQRKRVNRLISQEASSFTARAGQVAGAGGALTGLETA